MVPKPDDAITVLGEFGGTRGVGGDRIGVLAAVEFNRELARGAGEIGNAPADRMLTPESVGQGTLAERVP